MYLVSSSICHAGCLFILAALASDTALSESFSREEIVQRIDSGARDFSNLEASGVDLSDVDFAGAGPRRHSHAQLEPIAAALRASEPLAQRVHLDVRPERCNQRRQMQD